MLRSMTGFGKGKAGNSRGRVYIEIKSLNHKYFDILNRLPLGFNIFEDRIKSKIQKDISRGRLNLSLDYEDYSKRPSNAQIDIAAAHRYAKLLKGLQKSLGLSGDVTLQQVIAMPGVVAYRQENQANDKLEHIWPLIKQALDVALKQLLASKREEGRVLKRQLLSISKKIEASLKSIKYYSAELKRQYKNRLKANIKHITGANKIYNAEKIEEEAAIFIRNSDIAEEICRIEAHIEAFEKAVSNHKEVGRQLDFIAQELSREANTIGAKANNFKTARETIKIKSLVEKIREQTQNVE